MTQKIIVEISSRAPIYIDADADAFGKVFASMASDDQVKVFRAMVEAMKPHPTQWDHISIELESPENSDVRDVLRGVLFPNDTTNSDADAASYWKGAYDRMAARNVELSATLALVSQGATNA